MSRWPAKKLAEVSEVFGGSTPSRDNPDFWKGEIAWLSPAELPMPGEGIARIRETRETITEAGLNSCSATLLPRGAVVFSSRATIGKIGVTETPLATNQGFVSFVPSAQLSAEYLAYALLVYTDAISSLAGSTTFKEVSRGSLRAYEIPVPPLTEQERIVRLLDEAAALRLLRTQADERSAAVLASIFDAEFGDPLENPKGWPMRGLNEICGLKQWPTISGEQLTESGYPVYGANGRIGFYSSFNHERPTVLITCRGATCGTINVSEPKSYVTGNAMCCDDPDESLITQDFLEWALRVRGMADAITGAAQPQITRKNLETVRLPLPPLDQQKEFAARVAEIRALEAEQAASRKRLDDLFQSLLQRAFSGDL